MNKYLKTFFFPFLYLPFLPIFASSFPDLCERVQSFVLEEKQIFIPGYPSAFNPSIVRWHDGRLLLAFRARDPLTQSAHLMGFVWLNENFEPESEPTLLTIYGDRPLKISRAQDPRLIKSGDKYYIVYNNILSDDDLETRRMVTAELHYKDHQFYISSPQYHLCFSGDKKNWREKNWSPFDYNGTFHFSYSLNPHRVFLPFLENDRCETLAVTKGDIRWKWGELRGGTPSLLDGDEYLGFFHSFIDIKTVQSNGEKISHYFMGAYRFQREHPFALTHISPEPIIGKEFYTPPDYPTWKPLRVVFPGGLVFNDDYIWVVYGRQDFESWVVKLDKKGLMDSLVHVEKEV
jgi:predicted GH43/DUF377 family glycosyl hydrolase